MPFLLICFFFVPHQLLFLDFEKVILLLFQAEDGIRYLTVTGVQTCALPIYTSELQSQSKDGIRDLTVTGVQTCEIGRASGRERVEISVVGVSLKKETRP